MPKSQFRNLVFEGGGVKGIAYAGALQVLEEEGVLSGITRVAGTSAGAITATLLAVGAGSKDVARIVGQTDFNRFMDPGWLAGHLLHLWFDYGWYSGKAFEGWIQGVLDEFTGDANISFAGLQAQRLSGKPGLRELYMVGSDLSQQRALVFSAATTPGMPVWQAVRTSMSIPLFFQAMKVQGDVRVDGGVTWNYPLDIFDDPRYMDGVPAGRKGVARPVYNKQTLGFRVDTRQEIGAERHDQLAAAPIAGMAAYLKALVGFMLDMANKAHLQDQDWHRTVFIDAAGISATDFDLGQADIRRLIDNGRKGTREYFRWFKDPRAKVKPLNR